MQMNTFPIKISIKNPPRVHAAMKFDENEIHT